MEIKIPHNGSTVTILVQGEFPKECYKVGRFAWQCDGKTVIATKATAAGNNSINNYDYPTEEDAAEAAYKMALRQAKA